MRAGDGGLALATVLFAITTFVTILFLAISASLSHLNVVSQSEQREHAANLADAALDTAIERLGNSDFNFGKDPEDRVEVSFQALADSEGLLTFSQTELADGYSTFNLESETSVPGSAGRAVPAQTVHLVARGRVGSVDAWKEAIVHVPAFPDGLLATGNVDASGLLLTGVKAETSYTGGDPFAIPLEEQIPVNLFSNAALMTGGTHSVNLDQNSRISGSVGSPGSIQVSPDSQVAGEIRPGAGARPLPTIDIMDRIAVIKEEALPLAPSHPHLTLNKDWFNHSESGLNVAGDLDLNGSALTVKGSLRVGGSIKGRGIVLVEGDILVEDGGSTVTALDQVALACTGNAELHASSPANNFFQGLIYCEGDFKASDITIVGSVVVNGKNGKPGAVDLENVHFVYTPRSVSTAVSPPIGYEESGHSAAVSLTLTQNPDGETYKVDARLYITNDESVDDSNINNPSEWTTPFSNNSWLDVEVGPKAPDMGKDLGHEMGLWADEFEATATILSQDRVDWTAHLEAEIPRLIHELLARSNTDEVITFNLNNVLTQNSDRVRVLLRRPLIRE